MANQPQIIIRGAREHNLKGVDLALPRDAFIVFTGLSGSGKSSLAFDTIFREGQRRFMESLSPYARQFLGQMEKPHVDHIEGLSPTISIDQKTINRNPRSTVGTITEIYDHLRLLFARLGVPHCPRCGREVASQTPEQITQHIYLEADADGADAGGAKRGMILAPIVKDRKGEYRKELAELLQDGFLRARIDGEIRDLRQEIALDRYVRHTIEVVLDRVVFDQESRSRVTEAVERALGMGQGMVSALIEDRHLTYATQRACPDCRISIPEMEPRLFSFNSPHGACQECEGLGEKAAFSATLVVPDEGKSIQEGALVCLTKEGRVPFSSIGIQEIAQILKELGGDLKTPWRALPEASRNAILFGSKDFHYVSEWGGKGRMRVFEGVMHALEQAYKYTKADFLEPYRTHRVCPDCQGRRLNPISLAVTFRDRNIWQMSRWSVEDAYVFFHGLEPSAREQVIGREIFKEINARIHFLQEVGLGYLSLDRSAATLSGGEAQRIRLASQVGSGLQGVLYVLDEPSIGLHPRDNRRLLNTLIKLRDLGNTVLVVEHDKETMEAADFLVDIGPGAGREGGRVMAKGTVPQVLRGSSLTARYLKGLEDIEVPSSRRPGSGQALVVRGARQNNLKDIDVTFPLGTFIAVTGVSGSGKSTLITDILQKSLARTLHRAEAEPGEHRGIDGIEHLDKVIEIDQSPIGRTPRSNPATYTKVFDDIRSLFADVPEARLRGYSKGRFSFNVSGGRCEECQGGGVKQIEMQFLANVEIPCEACGGKRFNHETLAIRYKGRTIHEVLEMTVLEACEFFGKRSKIKRVLDTMVDVGLGYVTLGQPSTTLSGGEAQRVKLATELHRPATGRTLYILDEPTTGLHMADVKKLLHALQRLVDAGNTVIVIEHNLDVVKVADYVIDLGPEGGAGGGRLLACGTPEGVAQAGGSYTGRFLRELFAGTGGASAAAAAAAVNGEAAAVVPAAPVDGAAELEAAVWRVSDVNAEVGLPGGNGVLEAGESGADHPGSGHPGSGHPGSGHPGSGHPGGGLPGAGHPGGGYPPVPYAIAQAAGLRDDGGLERVRATRGPGRVRPRDLTVKGAHRNNLKHVDVVIPHNKMTVITGVSGSGKTSLAFDTLFAEGQRRYVESLSTYARRFLGRLDKAPVDSIEGIAPSISVDQKAAPRNPRSTVATSTEINDYLRLLYARVGRPHCPGCGVPLVGYSPESAARAVVAGCAGQRGEILAPLVETEDEVNARTDSGASEEETEGQARVLQVAPLLAQGFLRVRVDDVLIRLDQPDAPRTLEGHRIELVLDRVGVDEEARSRLSEGFEGAFGHGDGIGFFRTEAGERMGFSTTPGCLKCGFFLKEELTPQMFSFNSHVGACTRCDGLGTTEAIDPARLIAAGNRSILGGALLPVVARLLDKRGARYTPLLEAVAHEEGFGLHRAWESLPERGRELLLYGAGDKFYRVEKGEARPARGKARGAASSALQLKWRGLIPIVEGWYAEAQAQQDKLRDELHELMHDTPCPACGGARLKRLPLGVKVGGLNISRVSQKTVTEAIEFFEGLVFEPNQQKISDQILAEIVGRLGFLRDVGLEYLTLDRSSSTLSGGEAQRIRLASQLGSHLMGVLYVLDEPTIGLHPRDTDRLLGTLTGLRDRGNTVVVVEHDAQTILRSDYVIDMGPGAGDRGGKVVATGTPRQLMRDKDSVTGAFLSGRRAIPVPEVRRPGARGVNLRGVTANNLKDIDVHFPREALVCVTGVSGSGKSTLVMEVLAKALSYRLGVSTERPGAFRELRVDGSIQRVGIIDQSPLGRTPKSNPASYVGVLEPIRELFASMPEAKARGYAKGRFSFNISGGRCEACEGRGALKVEMHFLSDVWVPCERCKGKRYNDQTLKVTFKGRSIADVLEMEITEAIEFFRNQRKIHRMLKPLEEVGLGYMQVGQAANTMSGGEAQRVKLAAALMERTKTGFYILDEPTTGLHFQDVEKLIYVLQRLVDKGNTVVVIEHNPDVMKMADWLIDLGPEGGARGGMIVAQGTPEQVAEVAESHTGAALRPVLASSRREGRPGQYRLSVVEEAVEEDAELDADEADAPDGADAVDEDVA